MDDSVYKFHYFKVVKLNNSWSAEPRILGASATKNSSKAYLILLFLLYSNQNKILIYHYFLLDSMTGQGLYNSK